MLPDQGNTAVQMMSKASGNAQPALRQARPSVGAAPAGVRAGKVTEEGRQSVCDVARQALASSMATTQAVMDSAKSIMADATKQISESFSKHRGPGPGKPSEGGPSAT